MQKKSNENALDFKVGFPTFFLLHQSQKLSHFPLDPSFQLHLIDSIDEVIRSVNFQRISSDMDMVLIY